jgi:parallel beta-helix repeat protein
MDSRSITFLTLLLLPSAAVLLSPQLVVVKCDTNIIRVPNDFPTIQEAINAAENGSTILVGRGVYHEHLTVSKTLTLVGFGQEETIIDGSHSSVVVTIPADNVIIEGFTVQNSGWDQIGMYLDHSNNSIVRENVVTLNGLAGVSLDDSFNTTVSDNIISSTIGSRIGVIFGDGIRLWRSSANNTVSDNVVVNSTETGIFLDGSNNNTIRRNVLEANDEAVFAHSSSGNKFFNNDFIHNYGSVTQEFNSDNNWSVGGKGNYWDDYVGLDDGSGGRVAGDGIGDTNLPWNGVDNYPLINPANPFSIFWDNEAFPASLVSNSTVSAFTFDQTDKKIVFDVTGPANSTGHFNISIPASLLGDPWIVRLDGSDVTQKVAITQSQTLTTIYLSYNHSSHTVQIIGTHVIPEYPTATPLSLIILPTILLTVLAAKKRRRNKQY